MTKRSHEQFTAWRDIRWAFAAVWLLFLLYPISAVIKSDTMSTSGRIYTLVLLGAFAVIYLLASVYVFFQRDQSTAARMSAAVAIFVILTGIAVAVTATLDEGVFALAPYLMAVAAFVFPLGVGVTICVLGVGAAVLVPEMVDGWSLDTGIVIMLLVVGPTLLAVRVLRTREEMNEQSVAASRQLKEQLAVVGERERVARDVHDILGHSLTVMTIKSELAGRLVDVDPAAAKAEMDDLHRISREALAEIRNTVGGLRSPDLDNELLSARTALVAAAINPDLPDNGNEVDVENRILFSWALREAVTNVVRHSRASVCRVCLTPNTISVIDDGVGMNDERQGNGLRGLRERVRAAGGSLSLGSGSANSSGTTLKVSM